MLHDLSQHYKSLCATALLAVSVGLSLLSQPVNASDATRELQTAVHRLNTRLDMGSNAEGWRRFLLLNILDTQSAKGEQADIGTLQQIHQRFAAGTYGLDHPVFEDVRVALERQIDTLSWAQVPDLAFAIADGATQFRPITIGSMQSARYQAKAELAGLKHFYRETLPSYERAKIFYRLQLDELDEFLDGIEFELAPEVSYGKMTSMIRSVREELDEVVKKIDALPFDAAQDGPFPDDDGVGPQTPGPDNEVTLNDLQKQQEVLEKRIEELQEQRKDIRRLDTPRIRTRSSQFAQMREFERHFNEVAKDQGDPYFVSTKLAYERFVRLYYYGTDDNLQEDFLLKIQELREDLPQLADASARRATGRVGVNLEWMEDAFQVPHLVTAIRARHSFPNAYISVSSNLLNTAVPEPVYQNEPLDENIDGRLVRGHVSTTGNVAFDLQEDPNQVHLSILLNANVDARTYLRQGNIYAFVNASGQAEARRSLFANVGGLYAGSPYAAAISNSQFGGTSSKLGIVNRIAQKQFDKKSYEADQGAGNRIREEVIEQFSGQTETAIADGQAALTEARENAINNAYYVPEVYAHSLANEIRVVGKRATKSTLAAPNFPIDNGIPADIKIRLHDSMLSNYLDPIFAGKTFSDRELAAEFKNLTGETPETLDPDVESDGPDEEVVNDDDGAADQSFSITFTRVRPVQFEFENNGFSIVVSGDRFAQEDNVIRGALKIIMRFKIKRIDGQLKLVRDGKAEIDFVEGADDKTPKLVAFRSFLEGRLNPKDEEEQTDIELPENLLPVDEVEILRDSPIANALLLNQCRAEGGWLYLGWTYAPGGYLNAPLDLPAIWNELTIEMQKPSYTPVLETR